MTSLRYEHSLRQYLSLTRPALLSERSVPATMPAVLGTTDLTSLVLLSVFWITNITPMIALGGVAAFSYWILCGLLFFVPCPLILAQLARLFPHEGSFFCWTYHALGLHLPGGWVSYALLLTLIVGLQGIGVGVSPLCCR